MGWYAGQQLENGKYTILKTLGVGGFGVTYLAQNHEGDFVVIKTLNEKLKFDPNFEKFKKYFLKEASALATCIHPHIVRFHEIITVDDFPCIVMEYIPGENLYTIVTKNGALPETIAVQIIIQIGDALSTLHQQILLHGDVKPQNIILRSNTLEAVLVDFGISRRFISNSTTNNMGLSIGYSPPEQYTTSLPQRPYTDIYALAATLYFLLTGITPISALDRMLGDIPLPAPKDINKDISYGISLAVLKGMELEVKYRPQSIEAWIKFLKNMQVINEHSTEFIQVVKSNNKIGQIAGQAAIFNRQSTKFSPELQTNNQAQGKFGTFILKITGIIIGTIIGLFIARQGQTLVDFINTNLINTPQNTPQHNK